MILTSAVLGTLVGGLTSLVPMVIDYFNKRESLKYEAKMFELKTEFAKVAADKEIDIINAKADANEGDSLRTHDASLTGEGGFINALRASVRPVLTYSFFLLFVFVKVVTLWSFVQSGVSTDWTGNALAWQEIMPLIWDNDTASIFGAIIGFWFGGRTIEKLKGV